MYTDQAFPISAAIFSETNTPYLNNLNTSFLHPPVVVPPLSPASSEKSTYSYTSSSDEDFTFPMDQLNNVKKLLRMFPPPMSATEFINRNPFLATDGHIKRPSNNFILFRKIAHDQKNQAQELSNYNERQWSQIVGKIWKTLSAEEKSAYKNLGEQVASIHHKMFPEYKYQPKRDKAAWKHFNPVENSKKLKNKRKSKVRQQTHQETTPEISYQNVVSQQQQQIVSQNPFDFTAPAIPEIASNHELVFDGMFGNFEFNVNVNVNEVNDWINY